MRKPAKTLWFDRPRYVFLEFCVENSRDVKVEIESNKVIFSVWLYRSLPPRIYAQLGFSELTESIPGPNETQTSVHRIDPDIGKETCFNEDNTPIYNVIHLYDRVQPNDSREKRSDRSITCFLRKWKEKVAWPRLTKENNKPAWLSVDFDNWRDWDTEEEGEMAMAEHYLDLINSVKDKGVPPSMDDLEDLDEDM